ncbi:MAG: monooxygenase [Pseudonocardia sp.]|nr:monooxygenase [Pseudonocardia sp.]
MVIRDAGDHLVYNGRKSFSTGSKVSDVTVLEGVLEETDTHVFAIVPGDQPGIAFTGEHLHHPGQTREQTVGHREVRQGNAYGGGQHEDEGGAGPGRGPVAALVPDEPHEVPGQADSTEKDLLESGAPGIVGRVQTGSGRRPAHADQCAVQSTETVLCRLHQPGSRRGLAVVRSNPGGIPGRSGALCQAGRGRCHRRLVPGAEHHLGTFGDERLGGSEPQAAAATGHQRRVLAGGPHPV